MGKQCKQWEALFWGALKSLQTVTAAMKLKDAPWKQSYDQPRQPIKKQRITLPTKVHLVKAMVFPVVMDGCESWILKKAEHQRIDAFELWCWEKTLGGPLDWKEIKPVNPQRNQSWIFMGRTDAEAEAPVFWPADTKNWLTGKNPDAGKDWRYKKRVEEDEMVR